MLQPWNCKNKYQKTLHKKENKKTHEPKSTTTITTPCTLYVPWISSSMLQLRNCENKYQKTVWERQVTSLAANDVSSAFWIVDKA